MAEVRASSRRVSIFPVPDNLSPKTLPPDHYDLVEELGLIDLYATDMRIDNEETWLSGDMLPKTPVQRMSYAQRSASMDSLSQSEMRELADHLQSTPYRNTSGLVPDIRLSLGGAGDASSAVPEALVISPIKSSASSEDLPKNRTFEADGIGSSNGHAKKHNGNLLPRESDAAAKDFRGSTDTFSNHSSSTGSSSNLNGAPNKNVKPFPQPVRKASVPLVKPNVKSGLPAPRAGIRPAGPPVTSKPPKTYVINRASSLGSLSGAERNALAKSAAIGAASRPIKVLPVADGALKALPVDGVTKAAVKPVASGIPRLPSKLPPPVTAAPSRIPRPGAKPRL